MQTLSATAHTLWAEFVPKRADEERRLHTIIIRQYAGGITLTTREHLKSEVLATFVRGKEPALNYRETLIACDVRLLPHTAENIILLLHTPSSDEELARYELPMSQLDELLTFLLRANVVPGLSPRT